MIEINKKLLTLFFIVIFTSCSPKEVKEVSFDQLITREDLFYEKFSEIPFTGNLLSFYENGQLEYKGTYKDGKLNGIAKTYYENLKKKLG